jgi:serine/threonine protein kinase
MLERYAFVRQLPSGGFGNVAILLDRQLDRHVVIKTLIHPSPENRERFIREAKILYKLSDHEHIVDILDSTLNSPNPYIILEYCQHGTLQDQIAKRPPFGFPDVQVAYTIQHAALGLRAIHELGGVHRDIKPGNIFVGENKQRQPTIKLGDFGFGRLPYPHTNGGITRHVFGTEGYIAPEAYLPGAAFTQPCDIYSLGITGIELVTGSRDPGSIHTTWFLNGELKSLLIRMTSLNPSDRPTALEVAQAAPRVEQRQKENVKTALIGGAAVLALGVLMGNSD